MCEKLYMKDLVVWVELGGDGQNIAHRPATIEEIKKYLKGDTECPTWDPSANGLG